MSIAMDRGFRKLGRTILQWLASIGTTGLTAVISEKLGVNFGPLAAVAFQAFWLFVYTYAQNTLETAGRIPVLFPTPGLVSPVIPPVVEDVLSDVTPVVEDVTPIIAPVVAGTVDAVVDGTGQVVGEVTNLTGAVVGEVTGQLPPKRGKKVPKQK